VWQVDALATPSAEHPRSGKDLQQPSQQPFFGPMLQEATTKIRYNAGSNAGIIPIQREA
jgi:hypothetical protein